jgi:hypothetical protein
MEGPMSFRRMRSGGVMAVVLACSVASAACAVSQAGASTGARRHVSHTATTAQHATSQHGAGSTARRASRSASRPGVVLVNQPASRVCVGKKFTVGVWFQRQTSGGSRAYRVSVYSPSHKRVFFVRGQAPSAQWAFWKIPVKVAGQYHTVYSAHWKQPTVWTRYRVATTGHHC